MSTKQKTIPKPRQSVINKKRAERLEKKHAVLNEDYSEELQNLFIEDVV